MAIVFFILGIIFLIGGNYTTASCMFAISLMFTFLSNNRQRPRY
jgi:hypothetical protein